MLRCKEGCTQTHGTEEQVTLAVLQGPWEKQIQWESCLGSIYYIVIRNPSINGAFATSTSRDGCLLPEVLGFHCDSWSHTVRIRGDAMVLQSSPVM